MGEIANAKINGEMCEMCGVYLEDNDMGIPMYCSKFCAKSAGIPKEDYKYRILKEV